MSDDRRDGEGSPRGGSNGSTSPSRPVVTGTAAARYNAPRPSAPSENERTQMIPAVTDDGDAGSRSSGSGTSGSSSSAGSSGGADQPPWQRSRGTAVVDAPTSSIKRRDAATDMPDLSSTPTPSRPQQTRTASPAPAPSPTPTATASRVGSSGARAARKGPRRASLQLKHIDPWSTLKLSLVLSVAMFLVWMVAVGVLYLVLDSMGVWDRLNSTFTEFVSSSDPTTTAAPLVGPGRIFGIAAIIGAVNIVLLTALATIGAFIYNLSSDLAGGVEVTLTERD